MIESADINETWNERLRRIDRDHERNLDVFDSELAQHNAIRAALLKKQETEARALEQQMAAEAEQNVVEVDREGLDAIRTAWASGETVPSRIRVKEGPPITDIHQIIA